jgi:hypothetical protein
VVSVYMRKQESRRSDLLHRVAPLPYVEGVLLPICYPRMENAVDWSTALVSIVGNLAVAGVAIWALLAQTKSAERDRQHDLTLRRQERRSGAYVELMAALHRLQTGVERTSPIFVSGQPPEPPDAITDEESWHLAALADVVASKDVRDLIQAWQNKTRDFYNAVWYLGQVQQREEGRPPSDVEAEYGVTSHQQWLKLQAIREELRSDLRAIGDRARAEL